MSKRRRKSIERKSRSEKKIGKIQTAWSLASPSLSLLFMSIGEQSRIKKFVQEKDKARDCRWGAGPWFHESHWYRLIRLELPLYVIYMTALKHSKCRVYFFDWSYLLTERCSFSSIISLSRTLSMSFLLTSSSMAATCWGDTWPAMRFWASWTFCLRAKPLVLTSCL